MINPNIDLSAYLSGSCEPWTVDVILSLLHAKRAPRVLELGTYEGMTTVQLALTCKEWNGHLTTVEVDPARMAIAQATCKAAGVANVTFVLEDTISFLKRTPNGSFDFAFVDDDHDAMHVAEELDFLWSWTLGHQRRMSAGSLICMHDVEGPFGLGGVCIAHHGYVIKLPLLHRAGSLGVVQIP